jgi:hypothetical protein
MTATGIRELLDRYAAYRRREAQERGARAGEPAEAASRTADELRSLWTARGRDTAELDKLLHQADFRERVLALYLGPAADYAQAKEAQKALTVELREFWLSSGHDLRELRQFESAVDAEVIDMIIT